MHPLNRGFLLFIYTCCSVAHTTCVSCYILSKRLVIYIFILYASCLLVIIPTDPPFYLSSKISKMVGSGCWLWSGPGVVFIGEFIRTSSSCSVMVGGLMSLMFIGTSSDCCASCALSVAMGVLMSEPSACVVGLVLPSSSLSTVSNPSVCVISIGCVFVGFFILFSIVCRSRNFWRIEWWLFLFGRVTI